MILNANSRGVIVALVIVFFLIFPLIVSSYLTHLFMTIFVLCYLAYSWNIIGGYCGQVMLCMGVFYAIGAYTSALLVIKLNLTPWIGMFVGGIIAAFIGYLIGFLLFKYELKSHYFAVGTLAINEVVKVSFANWEFVESTKGLLIPIKGNSFYYFQFDSKAIYYYIAMCFVIVILLITYKLSRSKLGIFFTAIRENEMAADSIGIDRKKYKRIAFVTTAFFTSLAGSFYAQYVLYVHPDQYFEIMLSVEALCATLVGGRGTVFGPLLGGFIFGLAAESARAYIGAKYLGSHLIVNGLILMVMIIYLPRGIQPVLRKSMEFLFNGLSEKKGVKGEYVDT